jgi:hypothetical protein
MLIRILSRFVSNITTKSIKIRNFMVNINMQRHALISDMYMSGSVKLTSFLYDLPIFLRQWIILMEILTFLGIKIFLKYADHQIM